MALVEIEQTDAVRTIRLNRPEKLNSITAPLASLLLAELSAADSDPSVRAVILTGNGRAFCAGQDLGEITTRDSDGALPDIGTIVTNYNAIVLAIQSLAKPVIAAVNGVAAGAGANIALVADFVVAAESAIFVQSFIQIGLIPDSGGTFFLPRLVGLAKAKELIMLGEKLSARDASALGLIYRAVPEPEFHATVSNLATRLAALPTKTIHMVKQAMNSSATSSLATQLETELRLQIEAAATADYREGVDAFLAKRPPNFRGR